MSRIQIFHKQPAELLKLSLRLVQWQAVRRKTTSEHLLKMRGGGKDKVAFKSQHQVAMDTNSHMQFQPVPAGSWEENYRARNMKWSKMLYFSISALGITIYIMNYFNCFYLHGRPSRRTISPDIEKTGKIRLE